MAGLGEDEILECRPIQGSFRKWFCYSLRAEKERG